MGGRHRQPVRPRQHRDGRHRLRALDDVNAQENYILVSGNVPGAKKSLVLIKSAAKDERKPMAEELISYEETVVDNAEATETKEEN